MHPFRDALRALAALELPGLRAHFGHEELPETLQLGQLPALLVLPGETPESTARSPLFGARGGGFEALSFRKAGANITLQPRHLLLAAPTGAGLGLYPQFPRLVILLDAYFRALVADVTLGGRLLEPAQVQVEFGRFPHGGAEFHGCLLRHTWKLAL